MGLPLAVLHRHLEIMMWLSSSWSLTVRGRKGIGGGGGGGERIKRKKGFILWFFLPPNLNKGWVWALFVFLKEGGGGGGGGGGWWWIG